MQKNLNKIAIRKQAGQGLVEYIILVALVALTALVATRNFGQKVRGKIAEMNRSLDRFEVPTGDR